MPDPNNPNYTAIQNGLSSVASAGSTALTEFAAYENQPTPKDDTDVCAALAELRGQIESLLAAITATQADIGCTVI